MTAPNAPPLLGRHRLLAPTAGVHVSPLCLGAMNFANAWKDFLGECSKEIAFEMLDYFYEQGGNLIDTAGAYQRGESEQWIGEWMEKRGRRDEMVVATKYSFGLLYSSSTTAIQLWRKLNRKHVCSRGIESEEFEDELHRPGRCHDGQLTGLQLNSLVLRARLGFKYKHTGAHAVTEPSHSSTQGPLLSCERYSSVSSFLDALLQDTRPDSIL